jgi:CTP:phosphocholine cytidylyltransferase-like protein
MAPTMLIMRKRSKILSTYSWWSSMFCNKINHLFTKRTGNPVFQKLIFCFIYLKNTITLWIKFVFRYYHVRFFACFFRFLHHSKQGLIYLS